MLSVYSVSIYNCFLFFIFYCVLVNEQTLSPANKEQNLSAEDLKDIYILYAWCCDFCSVLWCSYMFQDSVKIQYLLLSSPFRWYSRQTVIDSICTVTCGRTRLHGTSCFDWISPAICIFCLPKILQLHFPLFCSMWSEEPPLPVWHAVGLQWRSYWRWVFFQEP